MQKACMPEHPGNTGYNEKIKAKDYRYRLEYKDLKLKGPANIFNKIMEDNFPNLKREMPMNIQEAYRTPNRLDLSRNTSHHIIIKTPNAKQRKNT